MRIPLTGYLKATVTGLAMLLHAGCTLQPIQQEPSQATIAPTETGKPAAPALPAPAVFTTVDNANNYLITHTHNGANIVAVDSIRLPGIRSNRFKIEEQRVKIPAGKHVLTFIGMKRVWASATDNLITTECFQHNLKMDIKPGRHYRISTRGSALEDEGLVIEDAHDNVTLRIHQLSEIECKDILGIIRQFEKR